MTKAYISEAAYIKVVGMCEAVHQTYDASADLILIEKDEISKMVEKILSHVEVAYSNPKELIHGNPSSQRKALWNYHNQFEGEARSKLANAYLEAARYAYRKSQNAAFYGIYKEFHNEFPSVDVEDTLVNINGICRQLAKELKELKEAETPKEEITDEEWVSAEELI